MRNRLLIVALAAALLPSLRTAAQNAPYAEAGFTVAYMTPNNFNMLEYSAWAYGIEQTAWFTPSGSEWWMQRRGNPQFGLKASFALVPSSLSGHRLGLAGMLRAPLWRNLDYQIGLGLSYYTHSQFFTHDEENIFISTLFSCLIDVGIALHIGDRALATFALVHSSNGMLNRPNKGLNYLQVGLGSALGEVPSRPRIEGLTPPPFARHEVGIALQGGLAVSRDKHLPPRRLFPCYDLSLNYQYYLDPVVAVGGTLDLWYNFAHRDVILREADPYRLPLYFGALAYVEGFWGPLSIKAGIGPSVGSKQVYIPFYERVGAYYNFGSNYIGVALNAHAGVIEFIEWSYGHRFRH